VSRVTQILHYGFGDPNTPKSFGGKKWALCGAALCPLFNAVRDLALDPTEDNASKVLLNLNIAINQAHNGGWWLNKFIEVSAYDNMPKGRPEDVCATSTAVLAASIERAKVEEVKLNKAILSWSKWPDTEIKPLKFRKVALDVAPNAFVLNLKASTLPIPRLITIPVTPAMIKSLLSAVGEIKIERGKIDLIDGSGKIINLWHEDPLVAESRDVHKRN
jgi:hypothetical protein